MPATSACLPAAIRPTKWIKNTKLQCIAVLHVLHASIDLRETRATPSRRPWLRMFRPVIPGTAWAATRMPNIGKVGVKPSTYCAPMLTGTPGPSFAPGKLPACLPTLSVFPTICQHTACLPPHAPARLLPSLSVFPTICWLPIDWTPLEAPLRPSVCPSICQPACPSMPPPVGPPRQLHPAGSHGPMHLIDGRRVDG
jgi:hypothetical protein